jgi:hypothetical protein
MENPIERALQIAEERGLTEAMLVDLSSGMVCSLGAVGLACGIPERLLDYSEIEDNPVACRASALLGREYQERFGFGDPATDDDWSRVYRNNDAMFQAGRQEELLEAMRFAAKNWDDEVTA